MSEISVLLGHTAAWISMAALIIAMLVTSEAAHGFLLGRFAGKNPRIINPVKMIVTTAASPLLLPDCACKFAAIMAPVLAIAALFPVSAGISPFVISPLIAGGDILQILHFMALSEICAITAIYALGTEYASRGAARLINEFAKLIFILTATFASLAIYFTSLGVQGNNFGLNAFTLSLQLKSMGVLGHAATAILVVLALSYSAYWGDGGADDYFGELPVCEYNGLQRSVLQVWASLKAFLTSALVTHIFFPWFFFKDAEGAPAGTFWVEVLGFVLFWLTVIAVRALGIILCRNARAFLEKRMSPSMATFFMLLLAVAAMGTIYYDSYITAMEAY